MEWEKTGKTWSRKREGVTRRSEEEASGRRKS